MIDGYKILMGRWYIDTRDNSLNSTKTQQEKTKECGCCQNPED